MKNLKKMQASLNKLIAGKEITVVVKTAGGQVTASNIKTLNCVTYPVKECIVINPLQERARQIMRGRI